jgi:hypothetical protein
MGAFVEQSKAAHEAAGGDPEKDHLAEKMWAGAKE